MTLAEMQAFLLFPPPISSRANISVVMRCLGSWFNIQIWTFSASSETQTSDSGCNKNLSLPVHLQVKIKKH